MNQLTKYFAVIFSSELSGEDLAGYENMARRMEELASSQEGFLGIESSRNDQGFGITVSYWKDEDSIREWKKNAEHILAQEFGRKTWYQKYSIRVTKVTPEYHHSR